MTLRLLILGGTTEASALARALADRHDVAPLLSLAGRTAAPALPPVPFRIGGFGGIAGLEAFLREGRFDLVVDATHPFAAQISRHAAAACAAVGLPLARFTRPPWQPGPGDDWSSVPDLSAAAAALAGPTSRVFLAVGRQGVETFRAAPQHLYLIRMIDAPDPAALPPHHRLIFDRGPFDRDRESALFAAERIERIVTKNSGGAASAAKLEAARRLGIPVLMVERPAEPAAAVTFEALEPLLAWIASHGTGSPAG